MARLARVVIPGVSYPLTHRGKRRGGGLPTPTGAPLDGPAAGLGEWLRRGLSAEAPAALREATRTGRPRGSRAFVRELEERLARPLAPQ